MKKYGNWIKFKDLQKKDKIFRIVNIVLALLLFSATLAIMIYYILTGDKNNRLLASIGMLAAYLIPFVVELVLRRRLRNFFTFCYLIYALFAGLIGSVLNVYYILSWYDIVVHILAGYVFSFFGIIILARLENYHKIKPLTVIIFCLFCTLAVELVWELCEWSSDVLLNQTAQGIKVDGKAPLVTDTDLDMLCNLTGGLIFSIQFLIGKYTKYNLGTKFFENELVPKYKEEQTIKQESFSYKKEEQIHKDNKKTFE